MMKPNAVFLAAALSFVAPVVLAFTPTTAEYSADWTMETEAGAMTGKLYHAANKERREMNQGGENVIMITRTDRKVMWNVMPSQSMYMEIPLNAQPENGRDSADLSGYDIEQTVVGEESVNGVKATKMKVVMKAKPPRTGKMGGFMWSTKEGIIVKTDVIGITGDRKQRIKMELTNLKIGKQSPSLFEPPAGYTRMDMGNMGAIMGGAYGRHR
jgi:Domain of unknown function (DUF4412)